MDNSYVCSAHSETKGLKVEIMSLLGGFGLAVLTGERFGTDLCQVVEDGLI